jgi:hypothetical protein
MSMHNLNLLSYDNVSKYREEGEHCREGRSSIDDEKGNVVDFETVGEVSNTSSSIVGMCDDDDFMASVNQLG